MQRTTGNYRQAQERAQKVEITPLNKSMNQELKQLLRLVKAADKDINNFFDLCKLVRGV